MLVERAHQNIIFSHPGKLQVAVTSYNLQEALKKEKEILVDDYFKVYTLNS